MALFCHCSFGCTKVSNLITQLALGGSARLGRHDGVRGVHPGTIRRFVLAGLSVDVLLGDVQNMHRRRRQVRRVRHPCADPDCHDVPDEHSRPDRHRAHWPSAGVDSHLGCQNQLVYRIIAAALGLLWIGNYVPEEWRVLVFISVGVVFFAMQFLRPAREWQWLALAYAVIGYLRPGPCVLPVHRCVVWGSATGAASRRKSARQNPPMRSGKGSGGDRCARLVVQQLARRRPAGAVDA